MRSRPAPTDCGETLPPHAHNPPSLRTMKPWLTLVGRRGLSDGETVMIPYGSKVAIAGAMVLVTLSLGGCATKKFVRENLAVVSGRVDATDTHLTAVEGTAKDALARATAAGKLAEGKFLFSEVLSDDSMKFALNKSDLTPEVQARLDAYVGRLKDENRNVYVEVQGHTDATGPRDYNYRLGEQRAEAVRRYLNQRGVALNRIGTISYGPDAPAAANEDPAGRQTNRRVVLIVLT